MDEDKLTAEARVKLAKMERNVRDMEQRMKDYVARFAATLRGTIRTSFKIGYETGRLDALVEDALRGPAVRDRQEDGSC